MLRVAKNSRWVGIQKRNRGSGIEATWNRFWNRESGIGVPWKSKWNRESGIEATWKPKWNRESGIEATWNPKRNRGSGSQVVLGIGVPFLTWFRNRLSDPGPVLRNSVSNAYLDVISCLDQIFDSSKKKFHFHFFMLFSLRNTLKSFFKQLIFENLHFFFDVWLRSVWRL